MDTIKIMPSYKYNVSSKFEIGLYSKFQNFNRKFQSQNSILKIALNTDK